MTGYDYFIRLFVILGLAIIGILATTLVSAVILLSNGMTFTEILDMSENGMQGLSAGIVRSLLAAQHFFVFLIPSFVFGLIFYRSKIFSGFDLARLPNLTLSFLGIVFLISAYPLVNLSFLLNEALPLPSWAGEFENQAEETLKTILEMNSPLVFFINFLLIAILPGIGEELIFRGIVQKHIGGWLKNPVLAIWIAAFIFSAIHMQFEGFLPRIVLGAILGYLYHWTKNLWVPIIAHAFNNGLQVILIYALEMDVTEFEEQGIEQLQWWMIPISVLVMYFIYRLIIKNRVTLE